MLSLFCVGVSIQCLSAKHDHEHPALEGFAYVVILAAMHAVFYNSPGSNKLVYDKLVYDPYGSKLEERTYFWFCCSSASRLASHVGDRLQGHQVVLRCSKHAPNVVCLR